MSEQDIVRGFEAKIGKLFPDCRGMRPVRIERTQVSPAWAKDSLIVRCTAQFANRASRVAWGKIDRRTSFTRTLAVNRFLKAASARAQEPLTVEILGNVPRKRIIFYAEAPGKPLSDVLEEGAWTERETGIRSAARLLAGLHRLSVRNARVPVAERISRKRYGALASRAMGRIPMLVHWSAVPVLPRGGRRGFVHNDFYPGNIIIHGNSARSIDVSKGGLGSPLFDLAQLVSAFVLPESIRGAQLSKTDRRRSIALFLKMYCALTGENITKIRNALPPFVSFVLVERVFDYLALLERGSRSAGNEYGRNITDLLHEAERWQSGFSM